MKRVIKRVIKFKGRRVDNGEWVEGYYVYRPDGSNLIYYKPFPEATQNTYHEVKPETVCQYTGLKDLYESDLILFKLPGIPVIKLPIQFTKGGFGVQLKESILHLSDITEECEMYANTGKNIHDKK